MIIPPTGPVIGLEYCGPDACRVCRETLTALSGSGGVQGVSGGGQGGTSLLPPHAHISESSALAAKEIENFYNFASMQMMV